MKKPPNIARLALAESLAQKLLRRKCIMEPPVQVKKFLEQYAVAHPLIARQNRFFVWSTPDTNQFNST